MGKFQARSPYHLHDPDKGRYSRGSEYLGDVVRQHIEYGGVAVNVYRLIGMFDQNRDALHIKADSGVDEGLDLGSFLGIQDTVLGETRDREYDFGDIPILRGAYQVSEHMLEYARYGLAGLTNDNVIMEFHIQTVEKVLGRRFIVGDVVEMTHLRDVSTDGRVSNKWYEIRNVVRSPGGYDPFYAFHIVGVMLTPMRNAQEFIDLMERTDQYGKTLEEQGSNREALLAVTAANQQLANKHAYTQWWDTTPIYFDPSQDMRPFKPTADGKAPNGIEVASGTSFPLGAAELDYFVRVDFFPNRLFQFIGGHWKLRKLDEKREWQPYNWVTKLREFMSDRSDTDKARGYELKSIHDALTPREDNSDPSPSDDS